MKMLSVASMLSLCAAVALPVAAQEFSQKIDMAEFGFPEWVAQASVGVQMSQVMGPPQRLFIHSGFYAPFDDIHFYSDTQAGFATWVDLEITNLSNKDWDGIFLSMINSQLPDPPDLARQSGIGTTAFVHTSYGHFHPCFGVTQTSGSISNEEAFRPCFPDATSFILYDSTGVPGVRLDAPYNMGPPAGIYVVQKLKQRDDITGQYQSYKFNGIRMHVTGPDGRAVLHLARDPQR
jgi:hypothetical protein